jgi:hypothetical protein
VPGAARGLSSPHSIVSAPANRARPASSACTRPAPTGAALARRGPRRRAASTRPGRRAHRQGTRPGRCAARRAGPAARMPASSAPGSTARWATAWCASSPSRTEQRTGSAAWRATESACSTSRTRSTAPDCGGLRWRLGLSAPPDRASLTVPVPRLDRPDRAVQAQSAGQQGRPSRGSGRGVGAAAPASRSRAICGSVNHAFTGTSTENISRSPTHPAATLLNARDPESFPGDRGLRPTTACCPARGVYLCTNLRRQGDSPSRVQAR